MKWFSIHCTFKFLPQVYFYQVFLEFIICKLSSKLNPLSSAKSASYRGDIYLPSGHVVLHWMNGQAENVIVVSQVQSLRVLLPIVHDSNGSNVIDHFSSLCVEQIVSTIVASVTGAQVQEMHRSWISSECTEQKLWEDKADMLTWTWTSRTWVSPQLPVTVIFNEGMRISEGKWWLSKGQMDTGNFNRIYFQILSYYMCFLLKLTSLRTHLWWGAGFPVPLPISQLPSSQFRKSMLSLIWNLTMVCYLRTANLPGTPKQFFAFNKIEEWFNWIVSWCQLIKLHFCVIYQNHNLYFWPVTQEEFKELITIAVIKLPLFSSTYVSRCKFS